MLTQQQLAKFSAPDGFTGDQFGHDVFINDGKAYVTAPGANNFAGAVYVFEIPGITVNSTADIVADDNMITLREALLSANNDTPPPNSDVRSGSGPDVITFDPSVFSTPQMIKLTSPLPEITTSIMIEGPQVGSLTIQRDTGGDFRIFTVRETGNLTLSDLNITNGDVADVGGGGDLANGGGILNYGTLSLQRCALHNNRGRDGGGIYNAVSNGSPAAVTLVNTTVSGNVAEFPTYSQGGGGGLRGHLRRSGAGGRR